MERYPFMKAGKQIGIFSYDTENNNHSLTLIEGVDRKDLPWAFIDDRTGKFIGPEEERQSGVINAWINSRIVPPERQNIREILEAIGLKEYDRYKILKYTRCSSRRDSYWIKFLEDDTYPVKKGGGVW